MGYGGQPHEVRFDLCPQGQTGLKLLLELRFVLAPNSKRPMAEDLKRLDLTNDLSQSHRINGL